MPRAWHDAIARQALFTTLRGNASFYKWRAKYGGMDASLISQMKAIEDENRRLKRMYADLSMQADLPWVNAARWPRLRWRDAGPVVRWLAGRLG